jgi:methyl-accepting chemotaxis protein
MSAAPGSVAFETLEQAEGRIASLLREAESAIAAVAGGFEGLAKQIDGVLQQAGEIIVCVQDERVLSMLPRVQSLGGAARVFIHERLQATAGVLEMVVAEAGLLERLSQLTRGQRSIARETQTLSVLTNIEVARLGQLGAGFQYLAHQLDEFSQSVGADTKQLAAHTEERQSSLHETRRRFTAGLPRIQKEFARIEEDLEGALCKAAASQNQLGRVPEQFRGVVGEIAGEIAGVVAAVQGHDITRQQLEHVREALLLILGQMREWDEVAAEVGAEPARMAAGLAIQVYQLRSVEETVGHWVAQIGQCAQNILRIGASEVVAMGPAVLEQERELALQLQRIERLEEDCEADSAEVRSTFDGLAKLMQLVGEHVERSRTVRDRLQLLTFNSIVEASHLGSQADAILEISQCIKRISGDWSELTDRSGQVKEEILELVEKTKGGMQTFSEGGAEALRMAQTETREGLENLHAAAEFAASRAAAMEAAIATLQDRVSAVDGARDRLQGCFNAIDGIRKEVETTQGQMGCGEPAGLTRGEHAQVKEIFSASYTTEMEREVLDAALCGGPLPQIAQNLEGNNVELF